MSEKDVREAAERWAKWIEVDPPDFVEGDHPYFEDDDAERADRDLLIGYAMECLAEHPADGDEAITGEWLEASGGTPGNGSFHFGENCREITLYRQVSDRVFFIADIGDGSDHWPWTLITRADFRLLARAAGVSLKE